jgi:hypothetical protein
MASYKKGDRVQFIAKKAPHKGKLVTGTVEKVRSMRSGCVGAFIKGDDGFDHGFIPLPQIKPTAVQAASNPAHGGNTEYKAYYLSIDDFGVYAYDSKTDKELLAHAHNGNLVNAIDMVKMGLPEARLVGARFVGGIQ